jgi:Endonuclease NucS
MLERQMEEAVAHCPEIFIEPGLTLIRRQVVINGRRPDILFCDALSRHLLVEIQCGRLDEDHLQRHFYYYFDYRAKYPTQHLRLMFIANRLVPQHKQFLDEHGYEFREYPEQEFARKAEHCDLRKETGIEVEVEPVTTPGALAPAVCDLLYQIELEPMTLCYKMLLLMFMAQLCDEQGKVLTRILAEKFQEFFVARRVNGKPEENPKRLMPGTLSTKTVSSWERTIREMPVRHLGPSFVLDEASFIRWAGDVHALAKMGVYKEVYTAGRDRLVRYFDRYVPGGF